MKGRKQEELLMKLEEIDALTSMDCVYKSGQKVTITGIKRNGQLTDWKIEGDIHAYDAPAPSKRGKKYDGLIDAIDALDKEYAVRECEILAYCDTEISRDWRGNIVSNWFRIEPMTPYVIKNGQPVFKKLQLSLSECNYALMMEGQIAFYDPCKDILYPLRTAAFPSVEKLLNCRVMDNIDEHVLGTALMIAEKISGFDELRVLCRDRDEKLRPVLSVMGNRYVHYPQKEFFGQVFNIAAKQGIFDVTSWHMSDEATECELVFEPPCEFSKGLLIKTGDFLGTSMSVTAFVKNGNAYVELKKNFAYHAKAFFERGGVPTLFDGIWDAYEAFDSQYQKMLNSLCVFKEDDLNLIKKILGKKRTRRIIPIQPGTYNAAELFRLSLQNTYQGLPKKQAGELRCAYKLLFDCMFERCVSEGEEVCV